MFFKKAVRRSFILIIAIMLLVFATSQKGTPEKFFRFSEKNFETPEDAINHFVKGLAANDLGRAFEACSINEVDHFDFKAFVTRLRGMPPLSSPAPSGSLLFQQVNRFDRLAQLARQVKFMMYSLLLPAPLVGKISEGRFIQNTDEQWIASFIKSCDSRKLCGLSIVKIKLAHKVMNRLHARRNALKQASVYGADDSTERIVLYRFNDKYYCGGVHLLKYGKYWRIDSLHSTFANTNFLGLLHPMDSPDSFDQLGE